MTTRTVLGGIGGVLGILLLMSFLVPAGSDNQVDNVPAAAVAQAPDGVMSEVFTCADGISLPARIEVNGSEFTAVGELVDGHDRDFTVRAYPSQIFASLTPDATASGSFLPGDMIQTSGYIAPDGTFQATNIGPACGAAAMVTEITGTPTPAPVFTAAPQPFVAPAIPEPAQRPGQRGDDDNREESNDEQHPRERPKNNDEMPDASDKHKHDDDDGDEHEGHAD